MIWASATNVSVSYLESQSILYTPHAPSLLPYSFNSSNPSLIPTSTAGGTPDRIGGTWQLRRISSVVVNNDTSNVHTLFQRDTHKGIILSTPLQLTLEKGRKNTITVRGLWNGFDYKGADLDRIVVYPPEK